MKDSRNVKEHPTTSKTDKEAALIEHPTDDSGSRHRNYRQLNKLIKRTKKQHIEQELDKHEKDPKQQAKILKKKLMVHEKYQHCDGTYFTRVVTYHGTYFFEK